MKVMDHIILEHQKLAASEYSHSMQYRFTTGKSGLQVAFLLTESIQETKDLKQTLFVAALDVQKAFDTVQHDSLLDKLYEAGVTRTWWNLKEDTYRDMTSRIVWNGKKSDNIIKIKQGNGQGKLPSPEDYKTYLKNLLQISADTKLGFHIGTTCVSTPTCADDILVLSPDLEDLQAIVLLISQYANEEHYTIHPTKSVVAIYNPRSSAEQQFLQETSPIILNGDEVPNEDELTHLGITKTPRNPNSTVTERIRTAKQTMYALMGSGFHGLNGLPVPVSLHLYKMYVLPRAMYGLETIPMSATATQNLDAFHKNSLSAILGLLQRTALPALYILTGTLPMIFLLHIRSLTFLLTLLHSGSTQEIVLRQHAMKNSRSASWVTKMEKVLQQYSLPTIDTLYQDQPSKKEWRKQVRDTIADMATREINTEAGTKKTLHMLNPEFTYNTPHSSVENIRNPRQVTRANIKTRLLTDVYPLEAVARRMKLTQHDTCKLCEADLPEDRVHFFAVCKAMADLREKYIPKILNLIPNTESPMIERDHHLLTALILDSSHPEVSSSLDPSPEVTIELEDMTRSYVFALHLRRSRLYKDMIAN